MALRHRRKQGWRASLSNKIALWKSPDTQGANSPVYASVDGNERYANDFLYPNHWYQGCGHYATPLSRRRLSRRCWSSLRSSLPRTCWPLVFFLGAVLLCVYLFTRLQRVVQSDDTAAAWS